ncbi:multisubunit sodium/proton antiporter MrpD subunit [Brevibacterium sanguinis]|uniref:Multisubunit sodium/proton antiporter MrpD subunit n=2 Tax=Brevibacterium TaxID=1696 RepID=A0A366IM92_9MICO|nr:MULTISPECIES: Na+/H+ antiporter subunit D [Brevibacterium]RBP67087.1 multisubunit sodium/proton antiporter MrpD subunit [Brevibacterium sanguinis]RBP73612.1 multisubunit sodium/proton antiporter MrpD subunit [Brevibacterium celere]
MTELLSVLVPLPVLLPLLGAGLALALSRHSRAQNVVSIVVLSAVMIIAFILLFGVDREGAQVVAIGGWQPPAGIVLVADRLSVLMLVVSSMVTLCVLVYALSQDASDDSNETPISVFNPSYLVLCAGVANAFLAGDLFNLYVGFEMLLLASYVLLTLGATAERIRAGVTYVVVSLVSSIIFLTAIGVIYAACGTVNMAQLSERLGQLPADVQMILHVLLLLGFGIKAAVFPLSFWLPDSYPTAPAPVTAVFAGLLTKVGIYAIIRTETLLFVDSSLRVPLLVAAALTMLVGILGAIAQSEIKRIVSFTLVSHIGYMLFGVALGTTFGLAAAIYYTVHHIIVQTALFLAIGMVEMRGGSTSTRSLGGLMVLSPLLTIVFFIPALNLSGIPPFSGFIGKAALFAAGFAGEDWLNVTLIVVGTVTSLLTLYVIGRTFNLAFWRDPADAEEPTEELVAEFAERKQVLRAGGTWTPTIGVPGPMFWATSGMVLASLALTVGAEPLWELSLRAAENLSEPLNYVNQVLGGDAA